MATSAEDIAQQHQEAVALLSSLHNAERRDHGPIQLVWKERPTFQVVEELGEGAVTPLFPSWSSRGTIDVDSIKKLVHEGYNSINPRVAPSTGGQTGAETKKSDSSDGHTTTIKKNHYTAADIKSRTNYWDPANAAVNNVSICRPSHDTWGINKIVLVFADDFLQQRYHFPWWHRHRNFQAALQPLLDLLQISPDQVVRLLFASLPPGVTIPVHQDSGEWVRFTHRVHVPVIVGDPNKILFRCGLTEDTMQRIECEEGHVFEINNQGKHAVSNCSSDHRVHLILDYVEKDFSGFKFPSPILLEPGETVFQTRRSLDRLKDQGQRPTPYFLILGAQKAGTTSLYEYLIQHPLVVPARRRETHCLDWRWNEALRTVEAQRQWCSKFYYTEQLKLHPSCCSGDSTPSYLLDSRRVIPRLQRVFEWKRMKFFVTIREPIQRAESHYAMVTSTDGTPEQLKARGSEWQQKSFWQVVQDDLHKMKECGLLPHWDINNGVCNIRLFQSFAGSVEENQAWDRYLANHVPLNTGSYGLLARGLYELQLRPWLAAFEEYPDAFLVLTLESLKDVQNTMQRVWNHLGLPGISVEDATPKNAREYQPALAVSSADDTMMQKRKYLEQFFAPYNQRLRDLLCQRGWDDIDNWEYEDGLWNVVDSAKQQDSRNTSFDVKSRAVHASV